MSITVVGSSAFDDIETPRGSRKGIVGGSCIYFSLAASFKTKSNIVSVVGKDFPRKTFKILNDRSISTDGLIEQEGKTFSWGGKYNSFSEDPVTNFTNLNVFESFSPSIPESYKESNSILFLANIDPVLQNKVVNLYHRPRIIGLDTMNFWIQSKRKSLIKVLKRVDILTINELELRLLGRKKSLNDCLNVVTNELGIKYLIVKRGSGGSLLVTKKAFHWIPSYPFCDVVDPTGAGDSYAGALFSSLDSSATINTKSIIESMVYASALSSFTIEKFGVENLINLKKKDILRRERELRKIARV
ncbi:sugar kinase [bacterium]|nr:sugar kinase [bacterium]|tara:strand:+ start:2924 stop:3829 length:906 start_codon:yes stop_codon:yes gene_type:complete